MSNQPSSAAGALDPPTPVAAGESRGTSEASPTPPGFGVLFSGLWIAATVTHIWNQASPGFLQPGRIVDPWYWAVLVAGCIALLRPASALLLLGFSATVVVAVVAQLPIAADHWILTGVVSAGLLVSGWRCFRRGRFDCDAITEDVAPFARLALIIGYSGAALAKLNTTFLDPGQSCAVKLAGDVFRFWGIALPDATGIRTLIVVGVTATELAVPILLLVPRTRPLGIGVAGVFHYLMGSSRALAVLDFTALLLALLVLFAPREVAAGWRWLTEAWRRLLARSPAWAGRLAAAWWPRIPLMVALFLIAGYRGQILGNQPWRIFTWLFLLIGWGVCLGLVIAALVRYRRAQRPGSARLRIRSLGHGALAACVLLTVASPYIGLWTRGSFTMFSNLRTEEGVSNHLFLPRLMLFDHQDDFVEVIWSRRSTWRRATANGERVHFLEVRRHLARHPEQPIHLVRNGETIRVRQAKERPELIHVGPLESRLPRYRNLSTTGHQACIGI
jgi:hypothetical protein